MEFVVYAIGVGGVVWLCVSFFRKAESRPKIDKNWEAKFWSDFDKWRGDPTNRVG